MPDVAVWIVESTVHMMHDEARHQQHGNEEEHGLVATTVPEEVRFCVWNGTRSLSIDGLGVLVLYETQ